MTRHFESAFKTIFLVVVSFLVVPPSPEWNSSWLVFAEEVVIRAGIVVLFVAGSKGVLNFGSVSADRLTPGPPQPPLPVEPVAAKTKFWARLSTKQRFILALSVGVFFVGLSSGWHGLHPIPPSPQALIDGLSAIVNSLCMALSVWWMLSALTQKRVLELAAKSTSVRWQLILIWGCIVLAFGYLLSHRIHRLWADRTVDGVFGTAVSLFCWGCLIVLWMPKPSQMSAHEPELLHIVPMGPQQNDHA